MRTSDSCEDLTPLEDLSREDLSSEDLRGTVSYVEYTTQHRTSLIFTHAVACAVEATGYAAPRAPA